MGWITTIFLKIAEKMGLGLQPKPIFCDDYAQLDEISLTAVIASRVATLAMQDSTISIEGMGARAAYMSAFLEDYVGDRMDVAAEVALGTGDCLVKPYTDGQRIGIDIIRNGDFVVCDSIGNYMKSVIIKTGEYKPRNGSHYERYEAQRILTGVTDAGTAVPVLEIHNMAFKDGKEVPLAEVDAWAGIQPVIHIANTDHLLLGRYKCPTVNRGNVNGVGGVKITYGLDNVMRKAVAAYARFNQEFEDKETFIFADKSMFVTDRARGLKTPDGIDRVRLPQGRERLFMTVRNRRDEENLIQEYSPDIRSADLQTGLDVNFKMLELLAGLSNGILTAPSTQYATATEMRAALSATFAFMTRFRRTLEHGTRDLLNAVDIIANRNGLAPVGSWDVSFDWSASYIEQMTEQFNRLTIAEGIGAVSKAEVRAWLMDEDLQTAQERVDEIAEQSGADLMEQAAQEMTPPDGAPDETKEDEANENEN